MAEEKGAVSVVISQADIVGSGEAYEKRKPLAWQPGEKKVILFRITKNKVFNGSKDGCQICYEVGLTVESELIFKTLSVVSWLATYGWGKDKHENIFCHKKDGRVIILSFFEKHWYGFVTSVYFLEDSRCRKSKTKNKSKVCHNLINKNIKYFSGKIYSIVW